MHAAAPAAALPEETATQTSGERVYMDPGAAARTWAAQTSTRRPARRPAAFGPAQRESCQKGRAPPSL